MMKTNSIIQRVTAALIFLTGLIFALLGMFGIRITVNQSDINNIIFGLSTVIAMLIEFVPILYSLIRDKQLRELLSIVNDVVYAVEESKDLTGRQKKEKALYAVAIICQERGIVYDEERVSNMIESVISIYNTVIKGPKKLQ